MYILLEFRLRLPTGLKSIYLDTVWNGLCLGHS